MFALKRCINKFNKNTKRRYHQNIKDRQEASCAFGFMAGAICAGIWAFFFLEKHYNKLSNAQIVSISASSLVVGGMCGGATGIALAIFDPMILPCLVTIACIVNIVRYKIIFALEAPHSAFALEAPHSAFALEAPHFALEAH